MRVALMSDLHANLPALEAVLDHARQEGAEAIWNLGDSVGYGAFPEEVVQHLRRQDPVSTLGRYDRQVVRFKKRKEKWQRTKEREEYLALEWAYDRLSEKSRKYLRFLSREIRMKVQGKRVLLTHGSPGVEDGCLAANTPEKQLAKLAHEAKAELILCGCSHQPFARSVEGVWFINPGSAGLPSDGDPRAAYAILEVSPKEIQVFPHRVTYDVERLVVELKRHKLPEAFARMFREGRPLDAILEAEAV
jgi:putative phosphoesterase